MTTTAAINARLLCHELAHAICGAAAGPLLITHSADGATTWHRGKPDAETAFISALAGPFSDMILRRGFPQSEESYDAFAMMHVVLNDPADLADDDSARARRLIRKVKDPLDAARTALQAAIASASLPVINFRGFDALLKALNSCAEGEGILVGRTTIDALVSREMPDIQTLPLRDFLADDAVGIAAAQDEAAEILAEMQRNGLIVNGRITTAGLLLLGD